MTNKQIDRIIRSTVHIIMSSVPELLPKGLGSGVLLRYDDYRTVPEKDLFFFWQDKAKFIRKIGHYFEFELSSPIADHADFKGTSGAPVMDSSGNIVSLITHGYEGDKLIYGIALSDFLPAAAAMIADEK